MNGSWVHRPWLRMLTRLLRNGDVRRRRANPVLGVYRWRYEVALVGVLGALVALGRETSWLVPAAPVLIGAVVLAASARARDVVRDRFWAVVAQHRLRTAFHELGLTTSTGRAPAIVWTAPREEGLRVHLVCPAGIEVGEVNEVREALAAACYASGVHVERDRRYANVVVLVVVTRVPAG